MPAARRPHTRTPSADVQVGSAPTLAAEVTEPAPAPVAGLVQRRETGDELGGTTAAPEVTQALARRRGGGRAMAPEVSQRMGEAMGVDVSGVRIHDDHEADTIARSVQSVAYAPGTPSGDHLLAHELAHTTQQSTGSGAGTTIGHAHDPAEAAADQIADGTVARLRRQATRAGGATAPGPKVGGADEVRRWPWSKKKKAEEKTDEKKPDEKKPDEKKPEDKKPEDTDADLAPIVDEEAEEKKWSAPTASPNPKIDPKLLELYHFPKDTPVRKHTPKGWRFAGRIQDGGWNVKIVPLDAKNVEYALPDGTRYSLPKRMGKAAEHVKETAAVFPLGPDGKPTKPKPEDVVQGGLGDCYLEAALSGLARTSPDTIMGMIRDLGDHVTVRLHDVDRTDPAKPTFTPTYIKVEKSRAQHGGELIYDKGALWVGMIEKAYAAGKFGGTADNTTKSRGKGDAEYADIAGGFSHYAFEVVTGKAAKRVAIDQGAARNNGQNAGLPWAETDREEYRKQKKKMFGASYTGLAAHTAYGKDTKKLHAWFKWLDDKGIGQLGLLYDSVYNDVSGYKHGAIRVEDFTEIFKTHGLGADAADPMLKYLERHFPGKRGTGKYSEDNLRIFTEIRTAIADNKTVALSSHDAVGRTSSGSGHSGGESKTKGMVGGHAFTALATKTDDKGVKYVQIRNPWGSYGREYDAKSKAKENQGGDGGSWIELSDVVKRFHSYDVV